MIADSARKEILIYDPLPCQEICREWITLLKILNRIKDKFAQLNGTLSFENGD